MTLSARRLGKNVRTLEPSAREALMDAAESAMGTRGVHAVSVSDLCSSSGYPNGSLYHHFGSKAGLLVAVLERGFARVHSDIALATSESVAAADRTFVYFHAVARSVDAHPLFHRLVVFVFLECRHDDAIRAVVEPFRQALISEGTEQVHSTLSVYGSNITVEAARELAQSLTAWLIGLFIVDASDIPGRVRRQVDALVADAAAH